MRAEDQRGHSFEPGQFAWLRLAKHATRFAEHPFSYTSSAYEGFSAKVASLPGFRVRARARGVLLVAYGIGITPSMSILRTAVDRGDTRKFVLVYANRSGEDATFAEELELLRARLDLHVVHVLSKPPDDWTGERGRITSGLMKRHLLRDLARWDFFLCGAGPPVDSGVAALDAIGVAPESVHAERFVDV